MAVFDGSFFPVKDFAYGTVMTAPSPATTGTSMVLNSAQGALFPAPATAGAFRAYVWPANTNPDVTNCEEIEVTAISTDTFTMVRQKSGIQRTIVVGDQVAINFGKSKEDQIIQAIKDGVFEDKLLPGESYSRDSTTQFKTPGDKTLWYTAGRILRINNAGTYSNHTVVSSSYSAPDTTVIVKGTDLPAALTNIYVGIAPKGKTTNVDDVDTLTNKLLKVTAAPGTDHTASGVTIALTANENQAFGDVCYIDADGEAHLIDADAIASMSAVVMCIDASISANASGNYLIMGIARDDTWAWTVGGLIYGTVTGTTGNTLSQTAPTGTDDVVQIIGVATHADRMLFRPQLVQVEHT